jgi:hypothetical protein
LEGAILSTNEKCRPSIKFHYLTTFTNDLDTYALPMTGYSLMTLGAIDYQRKLLEIAQRNVNAAFEYAQDLTDARSVSEIAEISNRLCTAAVLDVHRTRKRGGHRVSAAHR